MAKKDCVCGLKHELAEASKIEPIKCKTLKTFK